uniref:8 kDa glycoprotein n=1 Tax=Taenia multiceps TaxID=94034 RepID=B6E468_TAEMU|nr:8 kDa glycoprotein [Taenia multiceps]
MRAYIVLLALTVFVVAVLAENKKSEGDGKKWIKFVHNFFYVNPIGKQIAELAKKWNEAAPEGRCKVRALLAESCRVPKNKTA